jgi:hypothetical protein
MLKLFMRYKKLKQKQKKLSIQKMLRLPLLISLKLRLMSKKLKQITKLP